MQINESKRPRGRPPDAGKRNAILDATRVRFLEGGFDAVTIEGVAEAAGVSKGTIYKQFGQRDELIEALIGRESEWMEAQTAALLSEEWRRGDGIEQFGLSLVQFLGRPDVMALDARMTQAAPEHRALVARYFAAGPQRLFPLVMQLVQLAAERRGLSIENPAEAAADLMALWLSAIPLAARLGLEQMPDAHALKASIARTTELFHRAYGSR